MMLATRVVSIFSSTSAAVKYLDLKHRSLFLECLKESFTFCRKEKDAKIRERNTVLLGYIMAVKSG
jgi:hypothetical protein